LPDDRHRCLDLKKYLDGTIGGDQGSTYTRFWHGSASLVAAALTVLPVDGYRALLLNTTLALIGLSAVLAALNGLPMLLGIAPLLVLSFLLDGQFGYGQLVSHAPTQIASWAMAAFLIGWQSRLTTRKIILLAILLGCVQSFFDLLINVPLPASIFLVVATAVSLPRWRSQPFSVAASGSVGFGLAWGFGFLGSCVAKLALTAAVLGWGAVISPFIEQLRFRTGLVDPEKGLAVEDHASWVGMIGRNVYNLGANFWRLGYTDGRPNVVSAIIAVIALVGWGWAACRIIRALRRHHIRVMLINGTGYVAASLLVLAWVAVFPEHTWRHAFFMVRSAMIWIAGGWGWALTDYAAGRCWKRRTPAGESAQGKVT
jgi:hypothetical protein